VKISYIEIEDIAGNRRTNSSDELGTVIMVVNQTRQSVVHGPIFTISECVE